jgi:hypothetical protein
VLPIVVPVASWPLLHAVSGTRLDFFSPIFALLSVSLFFGGIPYVLVACLLLWILREQPASAYRRFSFIAPPAFSLILFLTFTVHAFFVTSDVDLRASSAAGAFYGAFAIPVGYLYVAMAHAAYWLLVRWGCVSDRSAA